MPNRLAHETSPYLRQHADNPVDWYPWGDEAQARARAEDKPILLLGRLLGLSLVSRDGARVVRGRGHGAPDERALRQREGRSRGDARRRSDLPAGAAAPGRARRLAADHVPHARGRAVLRRHLLSAARRPRAARRSSGCCWRCPRRGRTSAATCSTNSRQFREGLARDRHARPAAGRGATSSSTRSSARRRSWRCASIGAKAASRARPSFPTRRRWSSSCAARAASRAPRIPTPHELSRAVALTLVKMAEGGIYDQLGGGFARYSTDAHWLVPHFEKMLYDNAQLLVLRVRDVADDARADARARGARDDRRTWSASCAPPDGRLLHRRGRRLRRRRGQVLRLDARRGARGRRRRRRRHARGRRLHALLRRRPTRATGTIRTATGRRTRASCTSSIARATPTRSACSRDVKAVLLAGAQQARAPRARRQGARRQQRHGHRRARRGGPHLRRRRRSSTARAAPPSSCCAHMTEASRGRLLRTFKGGVARLPGTLDDHAHVADGLLALYEATGEARWLEEAHRADAPLGRALLGRHASAAST